MKAILFRGIYLFSLIILMMSCSSTAKIKKACNKAMSYLDVAEISYDHVFLYSHLRQKFNLRDLEFEKKFKAYENDLSKRTDENTSNTLKNIYLYRRLFDKTHKIQKLEIEKAIEFELFDIECLVL